MSPIQQTKKWWTKLPNTVKITATMLSFLFTVVGGLWAMDDRYVDQAEAAQSLQLFDTRIQQQIEQQDAKLNIWKYDELTERYYQLKRMQRMYPDDIELESELDQVRSKRDSLKGELGL